MQLSPMLGIGRDGPIAWPARCHIRHSLTDLLFEVVYVIDRSLIDSILDIFLQKSPNELCLET